MTRWTPDLLDRLRQLAAEGLSTRQAADALGLDFYCVRAVARRYHIGFCGDAREMKRTLAAAKAARLAAMPVLDWIEPAERLRTAVRLDLEREIAAAKAEAARVPLYRGGWPS